MPFSVSLHLPRSDLRPGHAPNQVTTGESRDETSLVPDTSPPLSLFIHQPHHQSTVTSGSHSHTSWPPMPHAAPPTVLKNTAKITPQLSRASVGWRDWRGPAVALLHPIPFQTQRQAIPAATIRNDCARPFVAVDRVAAQYIRDACRSRHDVCARFLAFSSSLAREPE